MDLGKQFFGFDDQGIENVIDDAWEYITKCNTKFDLIFMDVCYSVASQEGVSPPIKFLDQNFINSLHNALSTDGVCAINTMIKNEDARQSIFS